jgi:glycosyltransferase involved in cell wall biosynthesis
MMISISPKALFVGSFPPRECGIATFTNDVVASFDAAFGVRSDVIAIDEAGADERVYPRRVVARLQQDDRGSHARAAEFANAHPCSVIFVQHEYGLFGGEEGAWFLDFLDAVRKPVAVALHTVLPEPCAYHMRLVLDICSRATAVIVLSRTGRDLLIERYGVDPYKVAVIPHGVPDVAFEPADRAKAQLGFGGRMVVSTFGLLSRGKGLEYAIDAMQRVVKTHPEALYLILGETHPQVRKLEGESYRAALQDAIARMGLAGNVELVDRYLEFDELLQYLRATDIYLTPYLNPAQIVSGTLAYAIGCGKAVVSTPYLYAKELLALGRGLLADFRDAEAMAEAILALLDDPKLRAAVEGRAYRFGRSMTWPRVADEYGTLLRTLAPAVALPALLQPA